MSVPRLDPAANPLLFVINTSSGALDINPKRAVIESALAMRGRKGELMQDREAYKARFGRSRWVAFVAAGATLLRA